MSQEIACSATTRSSASERCAAHDETVADDVDDLHPAGGPGRGAALAEPTYRAAQNDRVPVDEHRDLLEM